MSVRISEGVAEVRFEGPIDLAWAKGLREAALEVSAASDVSVVLLRGEGRHFCPGGDLRWMAAQEDLGAAMAELTATFHEAVLILRSVDAPIVARVHGAAAGAGMSLVLCADLAVAARSATFTIAYTSVGLSPDGGSSWLLPRVVGTRKAIEILLLNPQLSAESALELGIVTKMVDDEELDRETDALVATLVAGPTAAYGAARRLVLDSAMRSFGDQLAEEARTITALATSPAGREGIAAFNERRVPDFRHSGAEG